jgi:copper chaperone CopZ
MITPGATTKTVLMVAGIRDNACRQKIVEALEAIEGVKEADVNLYRASATVIHDARCAVAELMRTVSAAGYFAEVARNGRSNGLNAK